MLLNMCYECHMLPPYNEQTSLQRLVGSIEHDFKKILNYMTRMDHNAPYWSLGLQEKTTLHFPYHFGCQMP
jgi:hypothetical protein